jgi:IMP dehydrogenase
MYITYDDIQLIPKYSTVKSRSDVSLRTKITTNYDISIPIVAAPMDTVCGGEMALSLLNVGSVGVIHRFMSVVDQCKIVAELYRQRAYLNGLNIFQHKIPIAVAIGISADDLLRAKSLVEVGADIIVIDVAHGHHKNVIDTISWCKDNLPVDIIAGSIATAEAAYDLQNAGADGLRVGIGNGSLCTTRIKTGFGVPSVSSIIDIASVATVPIIADGGIKSSGDIAKALAIGASCVMLGSMLAGTNESPGELVNIDGITQKLYRGSASISTKQSNGQPIKNIEGESTYIPYKGLVSNILNDITDGIKSALSYGGANSIEDFYPSWVEVSQASISEAHPHLIKTR